MIKRCVHTLIYEVLKSLSDGPKLKTHVCYSVRLDYRIAEKLFSFLEKKGYVKVRIAGRRKILEITEEGLKLLELLEELNKRLEELYIYEQ